MTRALSPLRPTIMTSVSLSLETFAIVDELRGHESRSSWIRRAVEAAITAEKDRAQEGQPLAAA
jgi:metal-responsive CopG/Arc/MetJ family transcriptional regulator